MLATTVLLCAVALLTACEGAGVDGNGFDKANNSPAIRDQPDKATMPPSTNWPRPMKKAGASERIMPKRRAGTEKPPNKAGPTPNSSSAG